MNPRWPRILMYHAVCQPPDNPNKIFTSPELFQAQMSYLKRRNLRGVSMRELRRAMIEGHAKGLVGLTFDDAYEDLLQTALPVLERFGFSATVFVVAGMLGKENDWEFRHDPRPRMKLLGADGIRELSARGMEVGSHSMTHPKLSTLEPELLDEEVNGSRRVLSEVLGEDIDGFSYPYGFIDRASIEAVRRARYAYACTVVVRAERNVYDLPRITVTEDNLVKFATKLSIYPQYAAAKRIYSRYVRPTDLPEEPKKDS
jgi:peptidoglycan/xylan/chitin deacetylase (PgdA/CDA1 family)